MTSTVIGAGPAPVTLKLAHYAAPGHPGDLAAKQFAAAVEKRTNGSVKVIVYPNSELGSPPEILEQNIVGAVDMSLPTQGALDKYSKKFAVVMMPFVFKSYQHAWKVLDGPFMKWAAPDLDKQGLVFLSNWEYGFRNITNNVHPINTPDDVKGLKLRVPPEIQLQAAMEALGAVVTKISFSELYMALKQNVVDGEENPLAVIYASKFYECQKHLALTQHVYNSMVHLMSKKTWNKLTPAQQKIVLEESKAAGNYMRKIMQEDEQKYISELQKNGVEITRVKSADFRSKMGPAYKTIENYAGAENVKKFLEMVDSVE